MPDALIVCPEAPYPILGGGQLRTACLLEYLSSRYAVDVIVFREPAAPDPRASLPANLVRSVQVVDLPYHSKSPAARALRNLRRFVQGTPPLMDRFGGFPLPIHCRYDVAVIEHFWCAPYLHALRGHAARIVLDLHNIESVLLERSAAAQGSFGRTLLRRFAGASRRSEAKLLPRFDTLLVTSEDDRRTIGAGVVWPNTIPYVPQPQAQKRDHIVFSGNMAYHPNIDAARHFASATWPRIRETNPSVKWRVAGRNPEALRLPPEDRVEITGALTDPIAEIATARAAVVPLLSGSGTRFKIIEAWAAGTPVISTTIGAEGLGATPGDHLLIADTPADFAAAVTAVLNDEALADRLATAGRQHYEANFTWPIAWKMLEEVGL